MALVGDAVGEAHALGYSACMRLHNWCIDHNTGKDVVTESTGEDVTIAGNGERRRVSQHEVNQWLRNDDKQRGPKAA